MEVEGNISRSSLTWSLINKGVEPEIGEFVCYDHERGYGCVGFFLSEDWTLYKNITTESTYLAVFHSQGTWIGSSLVLQGSIKAWPMRRKTVRLVFSRCSLSDVQVRKHSVCSILQSTICSK